MAQSYQDLINFFQQNEFKAKYHTCGKGIKLKDASLFSLDNFNAKAINYLMREWKDKNIERRC